MLCLCGRQVGLSETDADRKAVADLSKQANEQTGAIAELTKARVEQLKAEITAERAFERALKTARGEIIEALENALTVIDPTSLSSMTNDQLTDLILQAGLGNAIDVFIEQQDLISASIKGTLEAVDPAFKFDSILPQIDALQIQSSNAVFDEIIIPVYQKAIRESLRDLTIEVPVQSALSNLQTRMKKSEGSALTEVKTKLSQYGRSINAVASKAAGIKNYLYTGPRDGVTRSFCKALINLVVNDQQMKQLNNNQGLNVITSGGGYNCRHSWSPVTEGFITAAKLNRAKKSDIVKANTGAKK